MRMTETPATQTAMTRATPGHRTAAVSKSTMATLKLTAPICMKMRPSCVMPCRTATHSRIARDCYADAVAKIRALRRLMIAIQSLPHAPVAFHLHEDKAQMRIVLP